MSSAPGMVRRMRLRIPVRLKLAIVSAGLTFVILMLFALVVGTLTEQKLRSSFNSDLRATAADLQESLRLTRNGQGILRTGVPPALFKIAAAGGASVRVVDRNNNTLGAVGPSVRALGPPFEGVRDVGPNRVVARPLFLRSLDRTGTFNLTPEANPIDGAVAYVQYAKPRAKLERTTARVRLFLALGVIFGTALAFLAGLTVARRAMRPIADLTRAAREVARTRDPTRTLPKPEANDEVADLANTLEHMLRELDAARGETEAALERQRDFVADASHELRTPLTSILANLELLEAELARSTEGTAESNTAAEIAASALRSSKRMRRLVGDLLLLARADAGRQVSPSTVDLSKVARDAAGEASALASGHSISLDLASGGEAPTVLGAPDDLHRLVLNLLENALIHTPPGTPVLASVHRIDGSVRLEVADRGPGVPTELRERIFERFARPGGDSGRPKGSSGLGLAIVRAVTAAHGGTVEVLDAEGGGALFSVTFPAADSLRSASSRVPQSEQEPVTDLKGADIT